MMHSTLLPEPLGAARETELARRIEAGVIADHALAHPWPTDASPAELRRISAEGHAARQEFLAANLRLAAMFARSAARRSGMDFDEVFQEAVVALGHALQRFDPARGRFTTYAFPIVGQRLVRVTCSLAGQLGVTASRAVALRRAQSLSHRLTQELGRVPGPADISAALGRDLAWTTRLLHHRPPLSLDEIDDHPAAASAYEQREDALVAALVRRDVARLPGDQREVIVLRFGLAGGGCRGYGEIADGLGLSVTSVRRIERRGLATLRRWQQSTQDLSA